VRFEGRSLQDFCAQDVQRQGTHMVIVSNDNALGAPCDSGWNADCAGCGDQDDCSSGARCPPVLDDLWQQNTTDNVCEAERLVADRKSIEMPATPNNY
jgi:hypothetical protein